VYGAHVCNRNAGANGTRLFAQMLQMSGVATTNASRNRKLENLISEGFFK
jgi:hypothetical protein